MSTRFSQESPRHRVFSPTMRPVAGRCTMTFCSLGRGGLWSLSLVLSLAGESVMRRCLRVTGGFSQWAAGTARSAGENHAMMQIKK